MSNYDDMSRSASRDYDSMSRSASRDYLDMEKRRLINAALRTNEKMVYAMEKSNLLKELEQNIIDQKEYQKKVEELEKIYVYKK